MALTLENENLETEIDASSKVRKKWVTL